MPIYADTFSYAHFEYSAFQYKALESVQIAVQQALLLVPPRGLFTVEALE